jgi:hypothetical protein
MENINEWLSNRNISDCKTLRLNAEFIEFLKMKFPNKTKEEITDGIFQCCLAMGDIENFSACLDTRLSN